MSDNNIITGITGLRLNAENIVTVKYARLHPESISVEGKVVKLLVRNGKGFDEIIVDLTPETKTQLIKDLQK